MACNILSCIKGCKNNNAGGLLKFYVADAESITGITETNGTVTAIATSGSTTGSTVPAFYEFEFNKNSAQYVETGNIDLTNGSTFYTVETTLNIARREVAKRNAIQLLGAGQRDLIVIVKDANGIYWLQGKTNFANLTAVGEGSGLAKADGSKYSLTLTSEEPDMMPEVDSAIIDDLLVC
jgi:hypothetical protein